MPEGIFSFGTLARTIWDALNGTSFNAAEGFLVLGTGLWGIMCLWAFAHEAIDIASGKGTNLPKLLLRWAIIGALLAAWPTMADNLFNVAARLADQMPDAGQLASYYLEGYSKMQNTDQAAVAGQGSLGMMGAIVALPTAMTLHQISTIGGLVAILCYAIMLVSVAGIFSMLGIYLILGPVFIPLGLTDAFSSFFYKWVGVVLSFFLVIPIYGATLAVIMALLGGSVINLSNLVGLPSLEHIFQAVIGPIISVGLILGVNKIASSLTGAYFGQTGSMAFSIGAAAAGIGAKLGLSAATAGAGAPAAAGAGGASGAGAVTAAVSGSSGPAASAVREG